MLKWSQVLWASFMIAALAEALFFTVIDPKTLYLLGEPVQYSPVATYSIGFLFFWLICAAASGVTAYLLRRPKDVNAEIREKMGS